MTRPWASWPPFTRFLPPGTPFHPIPPTIPHSSRASSFLEPRDWGAPLDSKGQRSPQPVHTKGEWGFRGSHGKAWKGQGTAWSRHWAFSSSLSVFSLSQSSSCPRKAPATDYDSQAAGTWPFLRSAHCRLLQKTSEGVRKPNPSLPHLLSLSQAAITSVALGPKKNGWSRSSFNNI